MKKAYSQKKAWAVKGLRKAYENHMASLPIDGHYDLLEELTSGEIILHLNSTSLDELKSYVRKVFIESAPPCFIIRPTFEEPKVPPYVSIINFFRRLKNA